MVIDSTQTRKIRNRSGRRRKDGDTQKNRDNRGREPVTGFSEREGEVKGRRTGRKTDSARERQTRVKRKFTVYNNSPLMSATSLVLNTT